MEAQTPQPPDGMVLLAGPYHPRNPKEVDMLERARDTLGGIPNAVIKFNGGNWLCRSLHGAKFIDEAE